ncbi:flavin reductase family protein [Pararhizobium mangrovi]|uniref:Flavin reductase family protein n=1 Tax=Pararhizobium mangrovi TaxID=2590452 RepID=A0A506UGM9_9HYPH|nr:flavin reductase family protein [Pararhizobium mangrovi]TPW31247.1 flavin reductase family protein [Pararhizobium mangrovi]
MFYETAQNAHGLPHDPFKAIVSPRPIGWIGTRGSDGSANLAPYSYFNAVSDKPKLIAFSSAGRKHSARNAEETGVFTASLASRNLAEKMNASSIDAPDGVDEFSHAELEAEEGRIVPAPFVKAAYAALECRVTQIVRPIGLDGRESTNIMVFGQVVGIHIDEAVIVDGRIDMMRAAPLARLGYMDYADGADTFEMLRPKWQNEGDA